MISLVALRERKEVIVTIDVASIRLKSIAIWMALGDANSNFFHQYTSARRNSNVVWDLIDHLGNTISNEDALMVEGILNFDRFFRMMNL